MDILKKITKFEGREQRRLNFLYEYYRGKHAILSAAKPPGKPNNRLVTNFAKNIVNNTTGYFMGKPVTYKCEDENLQDEVNEIIKYNDDAAHNTQLSKDLSVFGRAAEILYIDNDGQTRYAKVNPMNLIIERSSDVEREILYAIRWYDVFDDDEVRTRYIELYTANDITYYTQAGGTPVETKKIKHYFGLVPINEYFNNDDCEGDFESVVSIMDAYNTMQSESVNDYQAFADAYLLLRNIRIDDKTEEMLKDRRVLETYEDGDASWLVKQVNDAYVENIKTRLKEDIYITSNTANMSDENFSQNASGVSIAYKLMNFENRIAVTERYFKKGLQRRFEMICNILNLKGHAYDYRDITPVFVRNIPNNVQEIVDEVTQLRGIVSKETLLSQIPFVDDVEREMQLLSDEEDQYQMNNFGRDDGEKERLLGEKNQSDI